jgi:hypothetical protein
MNNFADSTPLFPCSGRELAETISFSERAEYDVRRDDLLQRAEQMILDLIQLDRMAFDQIYQFDHLVRKNLKTRISTAGSIRASLKHTAMTAITSGSSGLERTEEKLGIFHTYFLSLLKTQYSSIDSQVIDILNNTAQHISQIGLQQLSQTIYEELDYLRREKTSITTKMSRIRRVAEMVIEPDSKIARELGEARLENQSDAHDWINRVSNVFLDLNPQLSKFGSSYEKYWHGQCQEVIERNQKIRAKERPRNYHLVEKMLTSDFSNQFSETSSFAFQQRVTDSSRNRPDFSSKNVTMDLKVSGKVFEAHFGLPASAASIMPNLQIAVLELLSREIQNPEINVSSSFSKGPTLIVSAPSTDVRKFGSLQLSIMKLLQQEIDKFLG